MQTFSRLLKYSLGLMLLLIIFRISASLVEVLFYEEDRALLLEQNKNHARALLTQYPPNKIHTELTEAQQQTLLFSLMLLEKNPEGLSQLEMLYYAHDLPLLFSEDPNFPDDISLETLYKNYRARLPNIGQQVPHLERFDFINKPKNFNTETLQDIMVISDFQMRDEESPFLLYPLKPYFPTSYYPANPHVPYIVEDSIKAFRQFEQQQQRHIDLALYTGDLTDNGHYNEVRWGIDVMDGSVVHPDSGKDDDIFTGLFENGEPNDTSDPFFATGMENTPWYFVPGNHDGLAMGVFQMTYEPLELLFTRLNEGTFKFMNDVSIGDTNYLGNVPNIRSMFRYWWSDKPWLKVSPDPERRLLNAEQIALEMFNSFSKPVGHGMQWAVDIKHNRSYSFVEQRPDAAFAIRHIALDTNTFHPQGEFGHDRLAWLETELQAAMENKQLVVVSSHHTPDDIYKTGKDLVALLNHYPNVIAHVVAHRHKNLITPRPGSEGNHDYWEIETGSMVNWPQQIRLLEIKVDQQQGIGVIESTMINHANDNPLSVSERGRFLAYLEAWFHGEEEKLVEREGLASDRNVRLYFELPKEFL